MGKKGQRLDSTERLYRACRWCSGLRGPGSASALCLSHASTVHLTLQNNPFYQLCKNNPNWQCLKSQWQKVYLMKPAEKAYQVRKVQNTTYRTNRVWEGITTELGSTKTRHWTHCAGCSQDPKVQLPVLFPGCRRKPEKWLRQSPLFILTYVCALIMFFWGKIFLGIFKGENSEWLQRNKMDLQTRAGNQITTLTSNFGIKYFGYTILSLWFWLFNTKHPVIKGRLVVVFFFLLFKFWQNSSPSPCTNLR